MATLAINLGAKAITSIAGVFLGQHTARLKDATDENHAAVQTVAAYDQDLQEIVAAWNSGQITDAQAVSALSTVDGELKQFLMSQVGKPGTHWRENSQKCDKGCTVGCCIYWSYYRPGLAGVSSIISGHPLASGEYGYGYSKSPISGGYAQVTIAPMHFMHKYANFDRPQYTIKVRLPKTSPPLSAAINSGNPVSVLSQGANNFVRSAESGIESIIGVHPNSSGSSSSPVRSASSNTISIPTKWILFALLTAGVLLLISRK